MVGYKLMQKYALLSLFHEFKKAYNFVLLDIEAKLVNPFGYVKKCFHSICYYSVEILHVKWSSEIVKTQPKITKH